MKTLFEILFIGVLSLGLISCETQEINVLGSVEAEVNSVEFETLGTMATLERSRRDGGSKALTLNAFSKEEGETLALTVINFLEGGSGNDFQPETYTHDSEDLKAVMIFSEGSKLYEKLVSCEITITSNDPDKKSVAGSFSGVVVSEAGDTLRIDNGKFDNIFY